MPDEHGGAGYHAVSRQSDGWPDTEYVRADIAAAREARAHADGLAQGRDERRPIAEHIDEEVNHADE